MLFYYGVLRHLYFGIFNLAQLLSDYYSGRNTGVWNRRAKIGNLKELNEICNYPMQNDLATSE